jgi:hypothetical protein
VGEEVARDLVAQREAARLRVRREGVALFLVGQRQHAVGEPVARRVDRSFRSGTSRGAEEADTRRKREGVFVEGVEEGDLAVFLEPLDVVERKHG